MSVKTGKECDQESTVAGVPMEVEVSFFAMSCGPLSLLVEDKAADARSPNFPCLFCSSANIIRKRRGVSANYSEVKPSSAYR